MRNRPQARLVAAFGLLTAAVVILAAVSRYVPSTSPCYLASLDTGLIYVPVHQNNRNLFDVPAGNYKIIRASKKEQTIAKTLADNGFTSLAFTNATVGQLVAYLNESVGCNNGFLFVNKVDEDKLGPPGLLSVPGPVTFSMSKIHHLSYTTLMHILACDLWLTTSIKENCVVITNATPLFTASSGSYVTRVYLDQYYSKSNTVMESHVATNSMYDALFGL